MFCISNKEAQTHNLAGSWNEVFYELPHSCVDKPALVLLRLKGSLLMGFGLKLSKCCPEKLKTASSSWCVVMGVPSSVPHCLLPIGSACWHVRHW